MAHGISPPRYAHSDGYTALAFSADGTLIITGGSDTLIRVFRSSQNERDKEALTLEHHGDAVVAVAASRSKIVTGDEEGVVLSFDAHNGVHASGTVLRSALPARDVSISASERLVAVSGDDDAVRVVSLVDMGVQHVLEGHRTAVSSAALAPDAAFVAAVGCDSTVRVWDVRGDATCVQVLRKLAYTCEPGVALRQTKARWSPDGSAFAVAGEGHAVRVVARNSWAVAGELGGEHTDMVTCVAWSGSGRYVASVALDGVVAVWDVQARRAVATRRTGAKLCQVAWNPRANMLAFTDAAGALHVWDDPVPAGQGYAPVFAEAEAEVGAEAATETQVDAATDALMSDLFAGDGMPDADGEDDSGEPAAFDSGDELVDAGEALDDFVVDDDGGGYAERPAAPPRPARVLAARSFQPGATPWAGDRRYLALNMVGSVVAIAQDAAHNTVEITFFDKSAHRDMHFADSFRFSLAALCDAGCLLATTTRALANDGSLRGAGDSEDASVVAFRAFAPWAAASDWTLPLPANEHPRCLAVSPAGAAVVTSRGMLRLLTCGGVQRHIESLPDRVVTCVAHGDLLLLLLARGEGDLEYVLMRMDGSGRLASGTCPLTPGGTAAWAGFSEEGHPAVCDSRGVVRLLHRYWAPLQACWVPVLDTRGRRAAVWPVALSARHLLAVTCRGASRYPPVPTPILDELPLGVPLLQPDAAASQLEGRALEAAMFHSQLAGEARRTAGEYPGGRTAEARDRLEHDKLLLRLVQLACKADRPQRAVDLAGMIASEPSFDACVKIAVHEKQSQLAERLMRLKEELFRNHDDDKDEEDEESEGDQASDGDLDQASDVEMASDDQRPPRAVRRPAATYGTRRAAAEPAADTAAAAAAAPVAAPVAGSAFARPPAPPTTGRPFNPFGVASPSKSMELKRSDSFFDAADAHSSALSREASASPAAAAAAAAAGHVPPLPAKRVNPVAGEADDVPRKASRTGAAGAAVTIPTLTAMGVLGYYAQHPDEQQQQQQQQPQRRRSASLTDREFILDDDPSEFSSFSSAPDAFAAHGGGRRRRPSQPSSSAFPGPLSDAVKPDHALLEEPHLQVWRDRYKWGRQYGMNYAHNDR
ncbi:DNA polymerase alpha accessory factor Mcl1 [Coemansia interrupta]|uniref:DNA polymerase alpha accessory factor Mcl1 n=1 Tax=Coemansia interrupta TaxID=1126814 RepID=A0A9W8LFX8_9FUNG|nr:DNA polymerase alpha accessory factor Mcl1 [Coemansia interrupta]